ncbi:MAG: TrkH family potassium uptake protein [Syntrophomonadaceae bacterium]|jgi:trk system potassium uptake protein TrkH|nr:TrkH family potassium uptake protein [Syntrophomonadaceae bacterium]MDH7498057.1 TrkH family potassium uptake protein [Syntrophomonadaceae bacterium]
MLPRASHRRTPQVSPAQLVLAGFAVVIAAGAGLLSLPGAVADGQHVSFLDALFTATSAVCVTGLVVVDTGSVYSLAGQLIILLLIQVGGLGIVTAASIYWLVLGRRIGLRERVVMKEALSLETVGGVVRMVRAILLATLAIEGAGALLLAAGLWRYFPPGKAMYYGAWHAVSAFCNAGFDLFGPEFYPYCSIIPFQHDWVVVLTIGVLIVLGGLGFPVLLELWRTRRWSGLSLHARLVLLTSALLLALGTVLFLLLEWQGVLRAMEPPDALLNSFFLSLTPRTAGYTTLDIGRLAPSSLLLLMGLMFVGASPVSTGGGVKTVALALLALAVYSRVKGRGEVEAFGRRIGTHNVYHALTVTAIAGTAVMACIMLLTVVSGLDPLKLMFEAFSAFGTVGLSTGITPRLNTPAKFIIIFLMFFGRVGPITVAFSLLRRERRQPVRYAEGNVIIG